ncbi:MltA-interacting protein MipA [Tepidimonas thermarum]|uniref:MltA-interacting protein MipA n=1 Tax=Tepidimonas thermarum TaxID=335431 RepID=A0A554WYK0_9BURK|nr:MipA/OmpV family protein [Tepidimonas thermarum]TSE28645.1 MltA-interacting protein MipA [Tepidimonas thermarum]
MRQPSRWWVCGALAAALPLTVQGQEGESARPALGYVLGGGLSVGRDAVGSSGYALGLRPVWGVWWGRFRLSSGGAASLWNVGRETVVDAGLSTTLVSRSNASLSASLRWDEGRAADDDDPRLRGVPAVRATLRGRLALGYALRPGWSVRAGISQDLLGRGGGTQWSAGLAYRHPVSARSHWDLSAELTGGSAAYRLAHYGIAPAAAGPTGRAAYVPGGGPESVQVGWGLVSALDQDWVLYGGVGVTRLLGAAARSPLVGARQTWGASVGVAYRR